MDLLISGGHIGVPKLYANMASPHKAPQSYLKHFGKQLRNCGSQRPETWQNCLYISLLWNFIFLASSTGRFPIYLFFCAVFIAWQWKTIYTIMMTVMKKKKRKTTQVIQFKVVGMLPKNIVVLPEKRTTTTYLQSIWLMHLHCERSYGCPNHYADNRQLNFHCLRKQHHPAKFDHFRHQIEQILEHLQRQETRVDDKRLARHLYPRSHHKRFPRCYYDTLQLFLPSFQILQPVSGLKSTKKMGT